MTFIIAIQSEDSVILASDTREFRLDSDYQLQPFYQSTIQKSQLWKQGIYASNGIDQIGQHVFNQLQHNHNVEMLQSWLIQSASYYLSSLPDYMIIDEQISCTQIYCSSVINGHPQLRLISQLTDDNFGINEMRVMTYQKDLTGILPLLMNLQQAILPRISFCDETSWMQYYLSQLQTIFYQMNAYDDWVSQDFHVYFDYGDERFFGYIPNGENCQVRFDI